MGVRIVLTPGAVAAAGAVLGQAATAAQSMCMSEAAIERDYYASLRAKVKKGTRVIIDMDDGKGDLPGIVTGVGGSYSSNGRTYPPIYNVLRFGPMDNVTINTAHPERYIEPIGDNEAIVLPQVA